MGVTAEEALPLMWVPRVPRGRCGGSPRLGVQFHRALQERQGAVGLAALVEGPAHVVDEFLVERLERECGFGGGQSYLVVALAPGAQA